MAFIYLSIFAMKRFFVVVHYYRALCFEFILNSAVTLTLSPFCIVIDAVRRRTSGVSGPFRSANNGNGMSMLRFYTEEAQGLKITPVLVLVISVCFIAFVTMLHAISKIYQYRNS
ncbi:type II secretory pathway family protein [Micromonas pusilla CCMP1545]|uniref:Type II secretory pathway family protein n=1 Tax=Micromonas pusilla (strain CCMP1545) TaxID=564608 RepID=C1MKG1_MICPC|nr:type II secretory pathway family protein [Micromonas pusilla CCMP1545]EEH59369.1 type II secretory pathway family protein [Micromonas pusilla CCMP1545]|eukprot:XP_003055993.1 type II secretory pathway family protein [Micromonas pusilla CCMP1545]